MVKPFGRRLAVAAALLSLGSLAGCGDNGDAVKPDAVNPDSGDPVDPGSPTAVRSYIEGQIPGGLAKLQVPAADGGIPIPYLPALLPTRCAAARAAAQAA